MHPVLLDYAWITIYSYPLMMGIAWGISYQVFLNVINQNNKILFPRILFLAIFVFCLMGAKFLYLVTSKNYMTGLNIEFWLGGGFVFYGGFLGGVLGIYLWHKFVQKLSLKFVSDLIPVLVLGHAIGRIGCYLAGCCYGKITSTWIGVYLHGAHRYPTQLIESLGLFAIYIIYQKFIKFRSPKFHISFYLISYGTLRLGVEFLRGDLMRGEWYNATPGMIISLGLIIVGVYFIYQYGIIQKINKNNILK